MGQRLGIVGLQFERESVVDDGLRQPLLCLEVARALLVANDELMELLFDDRNSLLGLLVTCVVFRNRSPGFERREAIPFAIQLLAGRERCSTTGP